MSKRSVSERDDGAIAAVSSNPSKKQRLDLASKSNVAEYFNHTFLSERDLQYEEDVKLHPYYVKHWLFYIRSKEEEIEDIEAVQEKQSRHKSAANAEDDDDPILWTKSVRDQYESDRVRLMNIKFLLYERALKHLPGSYKLWYRYLNDRIDFCRARCISDPVVEETNNCFERCLSILHKMPRIWMMYTEFLTYQRYITRTRKVFDRMLKALPITQHDRVWPLYLKFIRIAQVFLTIFPHDISS